MPLPKLLTRWWLRWPVALLIALATIATVPRWWAGRDGVRWFDGKPELVAAMARHVAATTDRGVSDKDFTNDSPLFKGEWGFGTYQMTALGLLQVAQEHPALRAELLPAAEHAIDRMLSAEVRAFDTKIWRGEDALESLDGPNGHGAYLGYMNLVLAVHRRVVPDSRFAELNDRITAALARRLRESPVGLVETYPGEAYPCDNAGTLASLILHQRTTGADHAAVIATTLAHYRETWRDPETRLLHQSIEPRHGTPGPGRASGTALAAFLLSYGERDISRDLHEAVMRRCGDSLFGFGYVDEYPDNQPGPGDVDSGPLIFGISPSGCAFSLGASRMFGNRDAFVGLYRTAHLMGTPVDRGGRRIYATGGPLGNALLFAMLTANPELP